MLKLPLLPLRGVLVFPYMVIHLDVGREKSVEAIEKAMNDDREIFLAMQKEAQTDEPTKNDIYHIGTIAEIKQLLKLPGGTIRILVEGKKRARINKFTSLDPYIEVEYDLLENQVEDFEIDIEIEALMRNLISKFEDYVKISKKTPPETVITVVTIEEPGKLADVISSYLLLKATDKQTILETVDIKERLEFLCRTLSKEMEILELEKKINNRVRKQMEKTQKEYYLREQIKAIQKELGEKNDKTSEIEELRQKIEEIKMPQEAKEKVLKELERYERMAPMVAEGTVVRNYLDWMLSLPWSKQTKDRLDINEAEKILDEDHYGLEKPKERILEYLAIRKLVKKIKGPILCLVGPPGVGKTSLAKSVARALNRKFVRMSLGGVRDEAEIRGHRRTYVGAMPGRIIQGIQQAGTNNPIFLLDEIDKMSSDFRGDPASALLEVLDPEQNNTFRDHYIEAEFDLSSIMFITTANVIHSIPAPLLDRMETIHISGYTELEKLQIATRYLLPKEIKEHGLKDSEMEMSDNAILRIIREYTRESGVRNLEREIASICRKVARDIVSKKTQKGKITAKNVEKYLGVPRYRHEMAEKKDEIGTATGLAWTKFGGEILTIEATVLPGKGKLTLTGKLGDVMKESAYAGHSYIRSKVNKLGIDPDFNEKFDIHIHVPEGAIPKDGPSAGITMAVAMTSALSGYKVKSEVAMTGEVTLRGKILPIGGLKEKSLAAHRAGIKTILFPKDNLKDLEDIPNVIKKKVKFIPVEHLDEVLDIALGEKEDLKTTSNSLENNSSGGD